MGLFWKPHKYVRETFFWQNNVLQNTKYMVITECYGAFLKYPFFLEIGMYNSSSLKLYWCGILNMYCFYHLYLTLFYIFANRDIRECCRAVWGVCYCCSTIFRNGMKKNDDNCNPFLQKLFVVLQPWS